MKVTIEQLRNLISESLLFENEEEVVEEYNLGYAQGFNPSSEAAHKENIATAERLWSESKQEFLGCSSEEIGTKEGEGWYGIMKTKPLIAIVDSSPRPRSLSDEHADWYTVAYHANRACKSSIFGAQLVDPGDDPEGIGYDMTAELVSFLTRVFIARTNMIIIEGPNDPNWGEERSSHLESAAFFRSRFPPRVTGGADTREQVSRYEEGMHNVMYFYLYGPDEDNTLRYDSSAIEAHIKNIMIHELGHARQDLTRNVGQAISSWFGLYDTVPQMDEGLVDKILEEWVKIPAMTTEEEEAAAEEKWLRLGGILDFADELEGSRFDNPPNANDLILALENAEAVTYSWDEVHNQITTDFRRALVQIYGPLPESGERAEVQEFYKSALKDFLNLRLSDIRDLSEISTRDSSFLYAMTLMLKDSDDAINSYAELASLGSRKGDLDAVGYETGFA